MKKILGLDLGTNSIGWALINQNFEIIDEKVIDKKEGNIIALGSRIIPMSQDILNDFGKGNSISQTATRTDFRSTRRLRERHLLRRERLHRVLNFLNFLPVHFSNMLNEYGKFDKNLEPKLAYKQNSCGKFEFIFKDSYYEMIKDFKINQPELLNKKNRKDEDAKIPYDWTIYYLRKKALTQKIEKEELAWLLLHFNQKRGYYQLRGEDEETKDDNFEIITQKIIGVTKGEKDKKYEKYEYLVTLENSLIYRASFYTSIDHWIGQTREFLYQSKKMKDGTDKISLSYLPSFDEIDAMDATKKGKFYSKIKIKTQNEISKSGKTVGQYIYEYLLKVPEQKIKGKLVRTIERKFYKDELTEILKTQIKFHEELKDSKLYNQCIEALYENNTDYRNSISSNGFEYLFRDNILFYQRPLKSKKSEISNCPFEYRRFKNKDGKEQKEYIKCAPRSHPLFQEFRLWQWIQNLRIYEREKEINGKINTDVDVTTNFIKSETDYIALFNFLNSKKEIDQKSLLVYFGKNIKIGQYRWNYIDDEQKKYPCNETRSQILTKLNKVSDIHADFLSQEEEIELWHIMYSVTDKTEIKQALKTYAKKKRLDENSFVEQFIKYPLIKSEYGSYSLKAIKKLLPLMRIGENWDELYIVSNMSIYQNNIKLVLDKINKRQKTSSNIKEQLLNLDADISAFKGLRKEIATYLVYGVHSEVIENKKWNKPEDILKYLKEFKQHSLRNPIVEQVITETLRVVHDIWKEYGAGKEIFFDEIHIELGREMKNNAADRQAITNNNNKNETTNLRIKALLQEFSKPEYEIENVRPYSPNQLEILKIYEDGILNSGIEIEEEINSIVKKFSNSEPSKQPTAKELLRYKLWLEQKYQSPYTGEIIPLNKLFTHEYEIEHIIPQSIYFDDSFSNKVICESVVNKRPYKDNQLGYEFILNNDGMNGRVITELSTLKKTVKLFTKKEYEDFVRKNYSNNKAKMKKLLLDEIPEKMIERQLNDTRYISKIVKNILSNLVREDDDDDGVTSKNIISSNGNITNVLKQDWGLNDVWNELITPRFERLNELTKSNLFGGWTNKRGKKAFQTQVPLELQKGFSKKRIDHRHHALDALIIASATRNHINYLNNQSALNKIKKKSKDEKQKDRQDLKHLLCYKTKPDENGNYQWRFIKPWEGITNETREKLEISIISFKQNLRVINKTVNYYQSYKDENGNLRIDNNGKAVKDFVNQTKGINWAIRKPLHKETIYGKVDIDRIKVEKDRILTASRVNLNTSFNEKRIYESITDVVVQKILSNHLNNYKGIKDEKGNEIKPEEMAFTSDGIEIMNKNIFTLNNESKHKPIYKVRTYEAGNRFQVGETGNKKAKYVEAAKGTNLFFAIYFGKNIKEEQVRKFETVPLNEAIERLKAGENAAKEKIFDNDNCEYTYQFTLSPNDLVYVPTQEEIENNQQVDISNITKEQYKRIYCVNDFSSSTIYFSPVSHAKNIAPKEVDLSFDKSKNKLSGSYDNKTASHNGKSIKENCWKLEVDRLGKITKVIR